ncbi:MULTISPECIES: MFS transporter [Catenuloplanes]|uniref:MFS family permease n=1 Tax=Catenuloplanes niger TaxID=587534 RepID=A0AAE4CU07_9ACTN|nr:MFS transporter [Catenuloplanes niger]MDR7321269.1 MFS family permease [Catenuloplanes niger]
MQGTLRETDRTGWSPAIAFAVNGALYGSLLPRFPELADRVSASGSQFGLVLFGSAAGGLLGSLVAPLLIRLVRERHATAVAGIGYTVLAVAVASAPDLLVLGLALTLMGVFDGAHDVTMNAATVRVQQARGVTLMGRMHATWSLSLAAAGVLGTAAVSFGVPVPVHVGVVAAVALLPQLAAAAWLPLPDPPTSPDAPARPRGALRWHYALPVLGLAALAASYVESPGQEWTGLLLGRGLDATPQGAAAAPVLFAGGLVASRLVLDAAQQRFGAHRVAVCSGLTMVLALVAGLAAALLWSSPGWTLAAVTVAGIGAGPIFPLLFGAADQLSARHGIPAARTASTVSALSRVGAISAPVVVGPLTEAYGMVTVLAVMVAGAALVLIALPRAVS